MAWLPTNSAAVVKDAVPLRNSAVPSGVPPSVKVTVPVGVPAPPLTVAVNVTAWPDSDGFSDEARAVDVAAGWPGLTTWVRTAELLAASVPSPWKAAVITWLPTDRPEVVNVACGTAPGSVDMARDAV